MAQIGELGVNLLEYKAGSYLALLSFFAIVILALGRVSAWFASL
jgi:hypothetical protein